MDVQEVVEVHVREDEVRQLGEGGQRLLGTAVEGHVVQSYELQCLELFQLQHESGDAIDPVLSAGAARGLSDRQLADVLGEIRIVFQEGFEARARLRPDEPLLMEEVRPGRMQASMASKCTGCESLSVVPEIVDGLVNKLLWQVGSHDTSTRSTPESRYGSGRGGHTESGLIQVLTL